MKPEGYPLPWCDKFNKPYYQVNLVLCYLSPEWRKKQAYKPMSEIIPWIDELIESNN